MRQVVPLGTPSGTRQGPPAIKGGEPQPPPEGGRGSDGDWAEIEAADPQDTYGGSIAAILAQATAGGSVAAILAVTLAIVLYRQRGLVARDVLEVQPGPVQHNAAFDHRPAAGPVYEELAEARANSGPLHGDAGATVRAPQQALSAPGLPFAGLEQDITAGRNSAAGAQQPAQSRPRRSRGVSSGDHAGHDDSRRQHLPVAR